MVNLQVNSWQFLTALDEPMLPDTDKILVVALAVIILIPLIAAAVIKIKHFCEDMEYLNLEVNRTTGEEQKTWIKRRRRHWLTLLPFVKSKR